MDMEKAKRSSCGTTFPEALGSNTLKMLLMTTSASHLMELTWRRKKSSNIRKRRGIGREGGKLVKQSCKAPWQLVTQFFNLDWHTINITG